MSSLSFRFPGGFSLRLFSLELESSLLRSLLARRGGGSLGFVVDRLQPGGFRSDGPASRGQAGQRAPQKSPLPVGAAAAPAVGQRLVKPLVQLEHRDGVRRARELGHGGARVRVVGVHGGGGGVLGGSVVFGRDELLDNRQAVGAHLRDGSLRGFPLHLLLGPASLLRDLARRVVRLFRVVRGDHLGKHGRERGDGDAGLVAPRRCFAFEAVDGFAAVEPDAAIGGQRAGSPQLHRTAKARDEVRERVGYGARVPLHVALGHRLGG